jgi:hypothetical protein
VSLFGHRGCEKFQPENSNAFDGDTNDITFTVHCLDDARDARVVTE